MNIKQTAIKSVIAGTLLLVGAGVGTVVGINLEDVNSDQKLAMMKQQQVVMAKQMHSLKEVSRTMQSACEPVATGIVSETFQITAVRGNEIWGEQANGLGGEGIYYTQKEFDMFGVNVEIGDYVVITWPYEAFANSEWDQIENIVKLEGMTKVIDSEI